MDTAWRLFYRDGYHAVGIDTVLAAAGVAKMTLYKHFKSKEDLIAAVLERRSEELIGAYERAITAAGGSATKRLLTLFDVLDAWFRQRDFNGCAFIKAVAEYPDPHAKPHLVSTAHKAAFLRRLTELAKELPARSPAALAQALMLLAEGAIVTAHVSGHKDAARVASVAAKVLISEASK
ncbi:MAG TPA: TetR/AcrR family transcriptional regulator [Opitutaceae bacterium]|nr:TetR/AcrR family transcriptional regulator [Opitutaceae bacterium]